MTKTKIKSVVKKVLIIGLVGLFISISGPTLIQSFTNPNNSTAHAADEVKCSEKSSATTICNPEGKDCPEGFKEDAETKLCKKTSVAKAVDEELIKSAKFLVGLQEILSKLIWPVLIMIGGLLDNSLLFGNGMEERLREIWIPIRNIVNILFVIALVGIALYNVLGIGDENSNYSIKAMLPKIIIGIIAVNFSFLGIKLFLDGINVLTTSIFALPNQVNAGLVLDAQSENHKETIKRFCRAMEDKKLNEIVDEQQASQELEDEIYRSVATSDEYRRYFTVGPATTKTEIIQQMNDGKTIDGELQQMNPTTQIPAFNKEVERQKNSVFCNPDGTTLTTTGELFLKRWNSRNAALAMALNLSNIVFYQEIDLNVTNIEKLFVNSVLSLLLYLLFLASFIALFIVLLARLVVLWLAIALSPLLLLGMVIPVVKEQSGFSEIQNQFVKNAIAPLGIALALSVGWIMLQALQGVNGLYTGAQISFSASKGIPVVGLSTLQDLITALATLAVIWLGVFTAASSSVAAPVTDMLKNGLRKAGTFVGTLPIKHVPFFHIDLPGVEGDENYTGTQVMEALHGLAQPKDRSKLLDHLQPGRKTVDPEVLNNDRQTRNKQNVYDYINSGRNPDQIKSLNPRIMKEIEKFGKRKGKAYKNLDPTAKGYIDILAHKDSTPDQKKTAARDLVEFAKRRGTKPAGEAAPKPGTTPAAPAALPTQIKNKVEIGGNKVTMNETQFKTYNDRRKELATAIGTGDKAKIRTAITALNNASTAADKNFKVGELEDAVGEGNYKKLLKDAFDDEEDLNTFLTEAAADRATP
jgi:hypothetical protein